jgi:Fe-S cluster biogenesis protein NfuA
MPDTSPIASTDVEPLESVGTPSAGGALFDAVAEVVRVIRPAIQADQGDIFLREVDDDTGVVSVELVGACVDCPASSQTLKQGLERILKQRVEGVTEVRHVGEDLVGFEEGTRVSL